MQQKILNKTAIVLGYGEVGKPIVRILVENDFKVGIVDVGSGQKAENMRIIKALHICIPYDIQNNFIRECRYWMLYYNPEITIIHSTIPMGTTRKVYELTNMPIVHNPVRGVHPNIYEGIKTFTKYIGPVNKKSKLLAEEHFKELGLFDNATFMNNPEETEMAKLLDTTYYGLNIVFCKEVKKLCEEYKLDFNNVYTKCNNTYNYGYSRLGKDNVVRPVLEPMLGEIGGHCIIPNCEILDNHIGFTPASFILKRNEEYKKEKK